MKDRNDCYQLFKPIEMVLTVKSVLFSIVFILILNVSCSVSNGTAVLNDKTTVIENKANQQVNKKEIKDNVDTSCALRKSFTGCCSYHGGMKKIDGKYQFNSKGFAICNDGTSSPSCNKCQ